MAVSSEPYPVRISATVWGEVSRSRDKTVRPLSSPTRRSSKATSNFSSSSLASAASVLLTSWTSYPSCARISRRVNATASSSSTISTVGGTSRLLGEVAWAPMSPGARAREWGPLPGYTSGEPASRLGVGRQCNGKHCPPPGATAHFDLSAVVLGDAEAHPQTEPGTLRLALGGVERLEDVRQLVLRNPRTGVADLDEHVT